jgi:hypothetical protein
MPTAGEIFGNYLYCPASRVPSGDFVDSSTWSIVETGLFNPAGSLGQIVLHIQQPFKIDERPLSKQNSKRLASP